MATPQVSADTLAKFRAVNEKNYADQAIFYLNAFWTEGAEADAENVWQLAELFAKEDHIKGKNGNELNPIQAFNLLQKQNKTMTALELKALLRKVDYDANGEMSLAEYLVGFNNRYVSFLSFSFILVYKPISVSVFCSRSNVMCSRFNLALLPI